VDFQRLAGEERRRETAALGEHLMRSVGRVVPVVPVPLMATVFVRDPERRLSALELKAEVGKLIGRLERSAAHVYVPRRDLDYALDVGCGCCLCGTWSTRTKGSISPGEGGAAAALLRQLHRAPAGVGPGARHSGATLICWPRATRIAYPHTDGGRHGRREKKPKAKVKRKKAPAGKAAIRKKSKPLKKAAAKKPAKRAAPKVAARPASKTRAAPARPAPKPAAAVPARPEPLPGEELIGVVTHYYGHLSVAAIRWNRILERRRHDPRPGTHERLSPAHRIHADRAPSRHRSRQEAGIGLKVTEHARENDLVYKVTA